MVPSGHRHTFRVGCPLSKACVCALQATSENSFGTKYNSELQPTSCNGLDAPNDLKPKTNILSADCPTVPDLNTQMKRTDFPGTILQFVVMSSSGGIFVGAFERSEWADSDKSVKDDPKTTH
ncbi:uncharacterized protein LOC110830607 [Zootermopsis nevadensis]|uniref:uncharacterized protein LOC110830607 n=1 Tax=Zootermopsis nevadensis TaxID=136037 RepID=UPI000B8EAC6C|nr:uncharacterized protein LOC110830607 [Zootermopsis nevadensis]